MVVPLHLWSCSPWFHFLRFQLPVVNDSPKTIKWKNSRNKQFVSFKLLAVLMKSRAILLRPNQDVNHTFVQHFLPISHLVAVSVIRLTVVVPQCLCSSHPYGPKVQE